MILKLLLNALAFYVTAYLVPGFSINGSQPLLVIAVVWGIFSLLLKPILVLLTLPINILSFGLFSFIINAALLLLMSRFIPGFYIQGFITALFASIVLSIVNLFLSKVK